MRFLKRKRHGVGEFNITLTGSGRDSTVLIDGVEQRMVSKVEVSQTVGDLPTVVLTYVCNVATNLEGQAYIDHMCSNEDSGGSAWTETDMSGEFNA